MSEDFDEIKKQVEKLQSMFGDLDVNIDYKEIYNDYGVDIKQLETEMNDYSPKRELGFSVIHPDAVDPKYNYETDSGFDLHSVEEHKIPAFGRALIPTGLCFDIPDGYELQIRPKSGLAINQGLTILNTPGTADCFSEDMRVLTINGDKKIEDIKIGEVVFSFNEKTLEIEKDTISHIIDTGIQEILIIETEYGTLEVTSNSEIYTKKGLKLACNLELDDEIIIF